MEASVARCRDHQAHHPTLSTTHIRIMGAHVRCCPASGTAPARTRVPGNHIRSVRPLAPGCSGGRCRRYRVGAAEITRVSNEIAPSPLLVAGLLLCHIAFAVFNRVVSSLPASYLSATFRVTVHFPFCVRSTMISPYGRCSVNSSKLSSKKSQCLWVWSS